LLRQNNDTASKNAKNEIQYNEHSDANCQSNKKGERAEKGKGKRKLKRKCYIMCRKLKANFDVLMVARRGRERELV
jgi:hypothetical protein